MKRNLLVCGLFQLHSFSLFASLYTAPAAPPVPLLVPKYAYLSKVAHWSNQRTRHLVIMANNEGSTLFPNTVNPVTVLINGQPFTANIFAKIEETGRFLKWVHISPGSQGALIIDLPAKDAETLWKQCDRLAIQLDPKGQVWEQQRKSRKSTYHLRINNLDYASGCGHLPG
jgi:hypothetical protein